MDTTNAELKARAIETFRSIAASIDRGEEIHRYRERGETQMGTPVWHEQYNDALRQLQQTGEDIKDWEIHPPSLIPYRAVKKAPLEGWINASALRSSIRSVLARVDPPEGSAQ